MFRHLPLSVFAPVFAPVFAFVFAMTLAACSPPASTAVDCNTPVATSGKALIGGDWTLTDHTGATRTAEDYLGKPQLVYFGFAFCPDVCPAALQRMGAMSRVIDPDGERLNYLFFTVDPERDTPDALAPYVASNGFAPGLVGLTGSREASEAAQETFKIYAAKRELDSASDYLYDHSDYIIVLDEAGEFHDIIGPDEDVQTAAICLAQSLDI